MTAAVGVSPVDAAQQALQHTRRQLFPFKFERWLALGVAAFLDQCGRTQTGFSTGFPGGSSGPHGGEHEPGQVLSQAAAWLGAHVMMVMAIAAVVLVLILCFTALVLWINSRGVFVYLDAVSTGRADVARPWREHAAKADSYFAWSFGLSLGALTGVILMVVTAAIVVFRGVRGGTGGFGAGLVVALVVLGSLLLIFVLTFALASVALRDFVAPIQMRTGLSCGACIGLLLGLLRLYPGVFVVYVLLKIVFFVALAFVVTAAACVTCCCALVPVVTQTLLQPAFYFERAWPLFLLRPMGYDLVTPVAGVPFETKEEPPDVQVPEPL